MADVITSNFFQSLLIHESFQDMHFITELTFDQLCVECLFKGGGGDIKSIPSLSKEGEKKKLIPQMWLTFES